MISQYSRARDIDREFWEDYRRAVYWLQKRINRRPEQDKLLDQGWEVLNYRQRYAMSEPMFYESPQTGNHWMMFVTSKRTPDGEMHMYSRCLLYHMTEAFMTMMLPMSIVLNDRHEDKPDTIMHGVNIYTAHMFQRFHQRLGVDMTDRLQVMRNFAEFAAEGWSDTRPPREGERHTQIIFRMPASWLRGHTQMVGQRHVSIYRTFWTDRSMSYQQLKDVRSFKRFADQQMSNNNNLI